MLVEGIHRGALEAAVVEGPVDNCSAEVGSQGSVEGSVDS